MNQNDSGDPWGPVEDQQSAARPTNDLGPVKLNEGLGSLAQSARTNHLRSARTIMFVIGTLTVLANLFVIVMAKEMVNNQFDKEVRDLQMQGMQIDLQKADELKAAGVVSTRLIGGAFVGMGIAFFVLGALVYKFPVPCTVLALVMYLAGAAITGMLDPATLAQGLIVKIIIIVALVKAIQAALAYRREQLSAIS